MAELKLDPEELRPLMRAALQELLAEVQWEWIFQGKPLLTEEEAADALGIKPHVLRDARLKATRDGRSICQKIGKRIYYSRADLLAIGRTN